MAEKYIYHVTTTTGHARKSPRSEISADTTELLKPWIDDMFKGILRGVFETDYACKCNFSNTNLAEFEIVRLDDEFNHTTLVKFVVCRRSARKAQAWAIVDGKGEPPNVPFCAVKLYTDNITLRDALNMPLFADVECCVAWAWLER